MNLLKICLFVIFLDFNIYGADMLSQWQCRYRSDGDVRYCKNVTALNKNRLQDRVTVRFGLRYRVWYVRSPNILGLYRQCYYDQYNGQPDRCLYVVVVAIRKKYGWCEAQNLQNFYKHGSEPNLIFCYSHSASTICLATHSSTNRLLHQTIPPPVYTTGIIFNILIILVLYFKADKSVLNFLLLMLSVWDLLYLGCLLVESIIGHYAHDTQIQISDITYVWLAVKCELGDSSACIVTKQLWYSADINISIRSLYYPIMYWLQVAALVFQIASVYQTTVIATFRCIAIRHPFKAHQLLTSTTAAIATGGCLLLGIAVHVPAFIAGEAITAVINCHMKYRVDNYNSNEYSQCLSDLTANPNPLYSASNSAFTNLRYFYHVITYSIVLFLALPFVVLLILNILMLVELYRGSGASHDDENKAVTKVVAAIVSVFLITYIVKPLYIVDIFYFDGYFMNSIASQSCGGYFTVSLIITVLPALNSVINLLLYLGLRETFREQFTSLFELCQREDIPRRNEAIEFDKHR